MGKHFSTPPGTDKLTEDEGLFEGVNKIIHDLENGMIGAAMETRRALLQFFRLEDFRIVDGYEEAVVTAHRRANADGSTREAQRIRRNFGKGIDFPRISRQAETEDDEADINYREAYDLMRDKPNSDQDPWK